MSHTRVLPILLIAASAPGISAQDVEMLGRRYGTRPPDGYYREIARNPEAFRFARGRAARLRAGASLGATGAGARSIGGAAVGLGPRNGAVVGDILIPVVLGQFSETATPPYAASAIEAAYFGVQPGTATVSTYYAEVSSDSITLGGDVRDWVRSQTLSEAQTAQGQSGLVCCGIGDFIRSLLDLQGAVDWGAYDNDGPDGVPNSGDDDGYVDALAVMHPSRGAECDGSANRVWSHKWTLSDASSSHTPYVTSTPRAGVPGQAILIEDYFVQGALSCDGTSLNEIGVFTHETGHAFGLPDLYDTRAVGAIHAGAGTWDLMASGTYGCDANTPRRPCHLGAWSKAMLGWATVETLPPDTDFPTLTLPPVESAGVVYRVDAADASGEYFLLENRQRIGFDGTETPPSGLPSEGLLVWQIDADAVSGRWAPNTVNASAHMGVWLRQADGLDQLGQSGGNRGDAGDPFPGSTGNTEFHAASNPSSTSFQGTASGLTVLGVSPGAADDVSFRLLTRFTTLTVETSGTQGASGLLKVDGATVADPPANSVLSAPFQLRTIEAAVGEWVAPGERRPFEQWIDAPAAPRVRTVTTPLADATYVAGYAGTQYQLAVTMSGGVNEVAPGTLTSDPVSPDLWFEPGQNVEITAVPRTGFGFLGWSGALAGQSNPASVTMDMPVQAGADFLLIYSVADAQLGITAAVPQSVQLTVQNGTAPVTWSLVGGTPPQGLSLGANGLLAGAALDPGTFTLVVEATDALGLSAIATLTVDVATPSFTLAQLASTFLLSGPLLDVFQQSFLDRQGNRSGAYDLGDFRAWVLANPSLPLSADLASGEATTVVALPLRLDGPKELR